MEKGTDQGHRNNPEENEKIIEDKTKKFGWDNWIKDLEKERRENESSDYNLEEMVARMEKGDFSGTGLDEMSPEELKQLHEGWLEFEKRRKEIYRKNKKRSQKSQKPTPQVRP